MAKSSPHNQNRYAHGSIVSREKCYFLKVFLILWKNEMESPIFLHDKYDLYDVCFHLNIYTATFLFDWWLLCWPEIWHWIFLPIQVSQYVLWDHKSAHVDMPTCVDVCRRVPICDIALGTYDTNHFDLICILLCVSTCGHADICWYVPTCADMCQHVASLSASLIQIIWTLFPCWRVSVHKDMPTCVDVCQHVTSLSAPLIPTIWNWSAFQYVLAHVGMPTCADMCRHVLTCRHVSMCANMWHHSRHLWYQPFGTDLHSNMC